MPLISLCPIGAAYLAHRHTTATLRDLAAPFGLNHLDSVSNLIRAAEKQLPGCVLVAIFDQFSYFGRQRDKIVDLKQIPDIFRDWE